MSDKNQADYFVHFIDFLRNELHLQWSIWLENASEKIYPN
jgi:hypothetical protein